MTGEGTEREGLMTFPVHGLFVASRLTLCTAVLEFDGRLKAQTYCPRLEGFAPESDE